THMSVSFRCGSDTSRAGFAFSPRAGVSPARLQVAPGPGRFFGQFRNGCEAGISGPRHGIFTKARYSSAYGQVAALTFFPLWSGPLSIASVSFLGLRRV